MTLPGAASLPSLECEPFDGPLDLLLAEVRRQNVAIEKIALAPLVARFLEYVHSATARNVNLDIEWLHMAATLIHWKARSLVTQHPREPAATDPLRDELVEQLLAHRKAMAQELAGRRAAAASHLARAGGEEEVSQPAPAVEKADETQALSVWDMIQQARELALWVEQHRADRLYWRQTFDLEPDAATVGEMIEYLQGRLATAADAELDGTRLLSEQTSASRRSCLFLGMLELAREQQLKIQQAEIFGGILLRWPANAEPTTVKAESP